MVAGTITGALRASDVAGRWGGEEFVLLAAEASSGTLPAVAERVRSLVEQSWLMHGETRIAVTISIGAAMARPGDTRASIVGRADSLMYISKQRGRNRVTLDAVAADGE
jgi:diguanylate cyclase (GGDEF)-like protein